VKVEAYQHGIYPRSEDVVSATRGLERFRVGPDEVAAAFDADLQVLIAAQREAGLDYFSDGLLRWQDIFRPLVDAATGLDAHTLVRWFDNNSFFRAPEVTGELGLANGLPATFHAGAPAPRVATLPSPYLFSRAAHGADGPDALMQQLARDVLAPVAAKLAGSGAAVIHLQEPWLVYFGIDDGSWDSFEKALTEIHDALGGSARLVLHTYFGDAAPHVDRLRRLPVDALGVDLVETDPESLGSGWDIGLLAGCLDGRRSVVEPLEGVVGFVRQAVEHTGAPFLLLSSNSDLELLPRDLARAKVQRLGDVAASLKEALA
jgi:5-methyltetrahydropteroyltriglutamate--homocysteine methyltransferase